MSSFSFLVVFLSFFCFSVSAPRCHAQDLLATIEAEFQERFSDISKSAVEILLEATPVRSHSDCSKAHPRCLFPPHFLPTQTDPFLVSEHPNFAFSHRGNNKLGPARMGTGVVFGKEKYILTSEKMVRGIENRKDFSLRIRNLSRHCMPAQVVGTDPVGGVAVLRVTPLTARDREMMASFKPAVFGDSTVLKPGSLLFMVSNVYGMRNFAFLGLLSGWRDCSGYCSGREFIQSSLPFHPGTVGAPICNRKGEVVGIMGCNFRRSPWQEISFAIPSQHFVQLLDVLIEKGCVPRGYLGVCIMENGLDAQQRSDLPDKAQGVVVVDTLGKSPAARAGIEGGDIIQAISGKPVRNAHDMVWKVANTKPDTVVEIDVLREQKSISFKVVLGNSCLDSPFGKGCKQ